VKYMLLIYGNEEAFSSVGAQGDGAAAVRAVSQVDGDTRDGYGADQGDEHGGRVPEWVFSSSVVEILASRCAPVPGPLGRLASHQGVSLVRSRGRDCMPTPSLPRYRRGANAARTSSEKSCGSSQAAKWPPLSASLKYVRLG
jgi:hypothetical protein